MELELQKSSYRSCGYDHDGRLCHTLPQRTVRALALDPRGRHFFQAATAKVCVERPSSGEFDCDRNGRATWIQRRGSCLVISAVSTGFLWLLAVLQAATFKVEARGGRWLGPWQLTYRYRYRVAATAPSCVRANSCRYRRSGLFLVQISEPRADSRSRTSVPDRSDSGRRPCFTCACSKRRSRPKIGFGLSVHFCSTDCTHARHAMLSSVPLQAKKSKTAEVPGSVTAGSWQASSLWLEVTCRRSMTPMAKLGPEVCPDRLNPLKIHYGFASQSR